MSIPYAAHRQFHFARRSPRPPNNRFSETVLM
jgi:hypothetical protein